MKKILLIVSLFIISFSLKSQHTANPGAALYQAFVPGLASGRLPKRIVEMESDFIVIRTVWSNPAAIVHGKERLRLALNYTKSPAAFAKANYPFAGMSYRITNKFTAGISISEWIGRKKFPGNTGASPLTLKRPGKTNHSTSLVAAYSITKALKAGIAGKFLKDKTTAGNFVLDMGITYDKPSFLFRNTDIRNQQFHFATSFLNIKPGSLSVQHNIKATTIEYHDMPSVFTAGAGYSFSIKVEKDQSKLKKHINRSTKTIDLHAKLHFQRWYKKSNHIYNNYKYQSLIGLGMDATVLKFFSLRMGYYHEMKPGSNNKQTVNNQNAKSIYWGSGLALPVKNLFHHSKSVVMKFEILTKNCPGLLDKTIAQRTPRDFRDTKLLFNFSIEISLKK